jgi:hypothetical protein
LSGKARVVIENRIQKLRSEPTIPFNSPDCICLKDDSKGQVVALIKYRTGSSEVTQPQESPYDNLRNFIRAEAFPEHSFLVIRRECLHALERKVVSNLNNKEELSEENVYQPYCDPNHPHEVNELRIAIEAWTKIYKDALEGFRPPKGHAKFMINWLAERYPKLTDRAVTRIVTLMNPNQKGGSMKS